GACKVACRLHTRIAGALATRIPVGRALASIFGAPRAYCKVRRERDVQGLLDDTLTAVMAATRAERGNVQMMDPRTRTLRIVAHRGFDADFLEFFAGVRAEGSCGKALLLRRRVIVPDVTTHRIFAGRLST